MDAQPIKVLLIEDSVFAVRHTHKMLQEAKSDRFQAELNSAGTLVEGQEHLARAGIDVVLLDLTLPDSNELETFTRIHDQAPQLPIVVLTGLEDESLASRAVEQGAEDYLIKGQVDSDRLKRSLLYAIARKRAENELSKYRDHLEELVAERTLELRRTNRRLRQEIAERGRAEQSLRATLSDLERSNHELDQFAYVASHHLQEPVRMVASYAQLLEKRCAADLDADAREYIAHAVNGAKRMYLQINDFLVYSRLGVDRKPFALVDCAKLLEGVQEALAEDLSQSGGRITCGPLPQVCGDERQLAQLFWNLLNNALKFSSARVPRICISAKGTRGAWTFSVKDNGMGIEPEYRERIFAIFQRLHAGDKYPGTGMGLALCKRIVERHGGKIWVESEPDKGSVFYFTIPKKGATYGPASEGETSCRQGRRTKPKDRRHPSGGGQPRRRAAGTGGHEGEQAQQPTVPCR
jgi:signal transduction histidine kinase